MSLANTTQLETLEFRFEQMRLVLQQQAQTISGLQSALANLQPGGFGGPSGGGVYEVTAANAVVIAAGSSGTATVSQWQGGVLTTIGTGTIHNDMQQPSVLSKTMILGLQPDGSYLLIDQSC